MRYVIVRFKKGLRKPIRQGQQKYIFICPFDEIKPGEYVLVETDKGSKFKVARVEFVYKEMDFFPKSFVLCKIPVKDFEKRCEITARRKKKIIASLQENPLYLAKLKKQINPESIEETSKLK